MDLVRISHPDCGISIMGNFNNVDIAGLILHQGFKQVVQSPTRDSSILDLILTDVRCHYYAPISVAPLESSHHKMIVWK